MNLSLNEKLCEFLYVTENRNAKGKYDLSSLSYIVDNDNIDEGRINGKLNDLAEHLLGEGSKWYAADSCTSHNQKLFIDFDDNNRLDITDIRDEINIDKCKTRSFIMVNGELTEIRWVITRHKNIYSG